MFFQRRDAQVLVRSFGCTRTRFPADASLSQFSGCPGIPVVDLLRAGYLIIKTHLCLPVAIDPAINQPHRYEGACQTLGEHGWVEFGASPRGSINLVLAARALALLRGRTYVLPQDVRALALDVLRHRVVPTYQALAEEVTSDQILERIVSVVPMPRLDLARGAQSA